MKKTPALFTFTLLLCVTTFADGMFISKHGGRLREPDQAAVILHDRGQEDMILQVKYQGKAEDFAWVIPTPSKPQVTKADSKVFEELLDYSGARRRWMEQRGYGEARPASAMPGGPSSLDMPPVRVLEQRTIGVHDVAVLEASDGAALSRWLNENGYKAPPEAADVFREYIEKDWVFTAVKIGAKELGAQVQQRLERGALTPLKFSFRTPEAIYPLRISSQNEGTTLVSLHVFGRDVLIHPAFRPLCPRIGAPGKEPGDMDATRRAAAGPEWYDREHCYFRPVRGDELPLCRKSLPRLGSGPFFLTEQSARFAPEDMKRDIVLRAPEALGPQNQLEYLAKNADCLGTVLLRLQRGLFLQDSFEGAAGRNMDTLRRAALLKAALRREEGDYNLLFAAARDERPSVRARLASVLARVTTAEVGPEAPEPGSTERLVPILDTLIGYEDRVGFENALTALSAIRNPPARNVLAQALRREMPGGTHKDYIGRASRRIAVLRALSRLCDPSIAPLYRDRLSNGLGLIDEEEMRCCLIGLGATGGAEDAEVLASAVQVCEQKQYEQTAEMARSILESLKHPGRDNETDSCIYLCKGMTGEEVKAALGRAGQRVGSFESDGKTTSLYRWGNLRASFVDNTLVDWRWR